MATQPIHPTRVCRKCGIEKPATLEFFFRNLRNGGLLAPCKECRKVGRRETYRRTITEPRLAAREKWPEGCKRCRSCGQVKATVEFYAAAECLLGVRPECKKCTVRFQSNSYFQRLGRQSLRRTTPYAEGEKKRCGRCHQFKLATVEFFPEDRSAGGRSSWCRTCKAEYHATYIKYLPHSRASRRAAKVNRNARLRGKTGRISAATIALLREEQGQSCTYCFSKLADEHIDHFIPLARGGEHHLTNLLASCPACNQSKGAKMPWDWRPDLFRPPK